MDYYTEFGRLLIEAKPSVRASIIQEIRKSITHPAYLHLLHTTNSDNVEYVMGYFRSMRHYELYNTIENIVDNYFSV